MGKTVDSVLFSLKLPAKFQSDMRNAWKDTAFMDDMASLDCVMFNSCGLDHRKLRSSTK
jgi:hypothetical protein